MSKEGASASTVTGTGEFERRERHVLATVEIREGVIRSVGFASADGGVPEGSEDMVRLLIGRKVSEALELDPRSLERLPVATCEVLLEAFYRAVETCLDPQ
jgi:hypothetical protein